MKQLQLFIPKVQERPKNIHNELVNLLVKASFIRQHDNGIYSFLPLGVKVLKKIEAIVYEAMNQMNSVEISTPLLQRKELMKKFPLLKEQKNTMLLTKDEQFVFGGRPLEQVVEHMQEVIDNENQLPLYVYQIMNELQNVSKKEVNLMRNYEMKMLYLYSFHADKERMDEENDLILRSFELILNKLNITYYTLPSYEMAQQVQWITPYREGDVTVAYSNQGSYYDWYEKASSYIADHHSKEPLEEMKKIVVPSNQSVETFFETIEDANKKRLKTLLYKGNEKFYAVVCRTMDEVSELKIKEALNLNEIRLATVAETEGLLSCHPSFAGPLKLPIDLPILADIRIKNIVNGIAGANENNHFMVNVNFERDFAVNQFADLRLVQSGDMSPDEIGTIEITKGMNIATSTQLNKSNTSFHFTNEQGEKTPFFIGVHRMNLSGLFAMIAKQHSDEHGLKWPKNIAPFDVHLLALNMEDEQLHSIAMNLYEILKSYRFDVLFDHRPVSENRKRQDANLLGIPIQIIIGEQSKDGILEIVFRHSNDKKEWQIGEVTEKLQAYFGMS